ncbi:glycosyl hydrolase 115 family protein [Confluentibacter flavum]|uniref:Glycosyl hydrolase n=1 Tax=Confluentibacter flavum TaxID=1909700 RepID=A0A2N3HKN2_9FLAO|nr:glycosyl hydrolase 115 family protein [Confluentibacter flavum]PKQ45452.1 glycosyl hydrolase [Confluentibacter flavum]
MRHFLIVLLLSTTVLHSQIEVSSNVKNKKQYFSIVDGTTTVNILYDSSDNILIQKSATFLASDIEKVTGKKPEVLSSSNQATGNLIIIGTIGNSAIIDQLIASKKLNVDAIRGQWERFIIQTIQNPLPNVKEALVVVGSDKRGAAYGTFTISEEIGVSPWHWWADVPAKKSDNLFVKKDKFVSKGPSVKYRGIFLNDEAPALTGWVQETFGSFNHEFYEKIFELLLRNKANYLWPAMWQPRAFAVEDPENAKTADEYGIVMSTSHHEPMMRAHEEWGANGGGAWNYETNKEELQKFWRGGIERMGDHESVVTVGMRGDGDEAMSEGTAVDLLKNIITDQRQIIADVTGKPAENTPQVWAIYKEVQDYYDKGMRVDDDITILFCDDNWGNIRILPKKEDLNHKGGYGIYYHFDFVGGPVSYRWLNVTQIERVWEQMNLAYEWGVKDLWIVNVGDLKPMELPISFFLDFGWDADMKASDLPNYYLNWADQQFGSEHAIDITEILALSTKYSARRTPEMLKPDTYSLDNYREADRILEEYTQLLDRSKTIYDKLSQSYKSAYYQLVHYPIEALKNLNEMYISTAKNKLYASQNRASTNMYADKVKEDFFKDADLSKYYHETLADGKWNHFMSQTRIGYTTWSNPAVNKMPEITYIQVPSEAGLGYVAEHGTGRGRFSRSGLFASSLPKFDPINNQSYYLEIFNTGSDKLNYSLQAKDDWVKLSSEKGTVTHEEEVFVTIDWNIAPKGINTSEIVISGAGREYKVEVPIRNDLPVASGFIENNGVVSMEAANYTKKLDSKSINWTVMPNMGRTNSSVTIEPANAERQTPSKTSPSLEYVFTIFDGGDLKIETYLSPLLNYKKNEGLKYAIAIDDEQPQIINVNEEDTKPDWEYPDWWNNAVTDHIRKKQSTHKAIKPGKHTLKVWMIDPGLVFQKFVIDAGGLKPSYLGPVESVYLNP